jgi:uncharacterized protein involved in exopolysaccharide biosynthesis
MLSFLMVIIIWARVALLKETQLRSEITLLNVVLGEALRNLEYADFALKNATPLIQPVDRPMRPLKPMVPSKMIAILIAGFVTIMLGSIWILISRLRQSIHMREIE